MTESRRATDREAFLAALRSRQSRRDPPAESLVARCPCGAEVRKTAATLEVAKAGDVVSLDFCPACGVWSLLPWTPSSERK